MQTVSPELFNALLIGALISLPFKAVGLWRASQNNQKGWFAALFLLNTVGVLELTYLFYFSEKKQKNLKSDS